MKVPGFARRKRVLLAIPVLLLGMVVGAVWTMSASASTAAKMSSGYGWIRLAHLSPNTPAVDVYLYAFDDSSAFLVLKHVSYGTVSSYERVAAGDYSVAMRSAGAGQATPPVLSTSVQVSAGGAYTVAGMGPASGLRLAVLPDRLTTPPGQALVRVIQASLRQHVVDVSLGGRVLTRDLAFGSVSPYQAVPAGSESVQVTAGGDGSDSSVALAAATVHTIVVLDGTSDLKIVDLEDAAGNAAMPVGGVATGFGGTAQHGTHSPLPWVVTIAAGSLLVLAGSVRLRIPARPRPRATAQSRS